VAWEHKLFARRVYEKVLGLEIAMQDTIRVAKADGI